MSFDLFEYLFSEVYLMVGWGLSYSTYLHVEAETLVDGEGMAEDGVSHRLLQSAMSQHDEGDGGHEHRDDSEQDADHEAQDLTGLGLRPGACGGQRRDRCRHKETSSLGVLSFICLYLKRTPFFI